MVAQRIEHAANHLQASYRQKIPGDFADVVVDADEVVQIADGPAKHSGTGVCNGRVMLQELDGQPAQFRVVMTPDFIG